MSEANVKRVKPDFRERLHEVAHRPGVYLMKDRLDRVIYVGKARDLRKRLANYFTPSRRKMADLKTRALIEGIWDFEIHEVRNEAEALLLEGKLIKEYRPRYNVALRDDKRFPLAKVCLDDVFPRFEFVRVKKDDGARYFGPFAHSSALRSTLDWMSREFGLRTCRPSKPGENDYRHCNDDVIRNCSAPCIGKIDRDAYMERVLRACAFLEGRSRDALDALEDEMRVAAEKKDFERAAQIRDMVEDMRRTLNPTRQFTRGRGLPKSATSGKDARGDMIDLGDALGLEAPPLVMECFDISNISSTHCVASMVRFREGRPENAAYRRYRIRDVDGQNDFASMAEVIRRRYARILLEARGRVAGELEGGQERAIDVMRRLQKRMQGPDNRTRPFVSLPDLVIVDGGKGQLSAAVRELRRLDLGDLPVIGLAKEREEIFRPGDPQPLVLRHDRGGLQLLQRIRDEAHRFANGYHQLLMKRRIAESILDDCPGVSESRKKALLAAFGSVARLRNASPEAIAAVKGVGPVLAREVRDFLQSRSQEVRRGE
jgi:excinuclease ABC subunit C